MAKFKVGDRVRYTHSRAVERWGRYVDGMRRDGIGVGVITEDGDDDSYRIAFATGTWWYPSFSLQHNVIASKAELEALYG